MKAIRLAVLPFALVAPLIAGACSDSSSSALTPTSAATDRGGMASHDAAGLPDGDYEANLHPLNPGVQEHSDVRGVAHGKAYFSVRHGQFTATVNAEGVRQGMIHPQHIHSAANCPPASADVNHDGFVDVIEGVPFYGPILIPLDDNLSSQASGTCPTASGVRGLLRYMSSTSLSALLADLNAPDPDPTDAVIKLGGAPLGLEARHVVVHGVDASTALPSSVASLPGVPAYLTLPIACGEIRRIR
jgi:hypothetical protein